MNQLGTQEYDFKLLLSLQRSTKQRTQMREDVDTLAHRVAEKENINLELELRRIMLRKAFVKGYGG